VTATAKSPILRRDLDTPAGPIALLDTGPGPGSGRAPVLLVPGYTGSKEDFAAVLAPLAEAGHRVVAMDLRGQYESPGPDDPAAYTVEALGADVRAVLADVGGPAHLVGHSFGGLVSRAAAVADPGALASLTLMCSGPAAIGGERKARIDLLAPVLAAGGMTGVYDAIEALGDADPRAAALSPELRAFLRRRFLASSPVGLEAMGRALTGEPDRVGELAGTGIPMLVLHGADDDAWPPAQQHAMAGHLGAAYAVISKAAHSPAVENPGDTAGALRDFWATVERDGP
jgi:pimeloyl-ACP methyl ester carboxylesterase